MALTPRKLVTIVTEASLEKVLVKDFKALGVKGYTLLECEGEGERGVRGGDWDQNKNIMFKIVCSESVAQNVMSFLHDKYYEDYAMISYASDVQVYRDTKF